MSPTARVWGRRPGRHRTLLAAGLLAAAACATEESTPTLPPPPPTEIREVVETLHGATVKDPYRWLEDQESPQTRAWIDAQNQYTDSLLRGLPERDRLRELASKVLQIDTIGLPTERGGRYFFMKRRADQDLSVLYVREGLRGEDYVLIDPHPMSHDHTTSIELRDVSPDGALIVYALRDGGVDEVSLHVMNVGTRTDLPDVLPAARYGEVNLTPDKKGFYYERYGDVTPRVMYHQVGTDPSKDKMLFGDGYQRHHIPVTLLSEDGRWLLVHVVEGSSGPTELHLKDLKSDRPFVTMIKDGVTESFGEFAGDRIVVTTNLNAPNKRLMLVDPMKPAVDQWQEIVPERPDVVIASASGLGGKLAVFYLKDVQPKVAIHEITGAHVRDISFETIGSVGGGSGRWDSHEAFFTFQTLHVPSTIYRYDIQSGAQEEWARIEVPIDAAPIEVTQVRYRSKDGTMVPMFMAHRKGLTRDGSNPTLLTGYGGFNLSRTPEFSAFAAAWLELGGVYALANMRGGGELGEAWHRAGMLDKKQNVFDDFVAAAEYLIAERYTSPQTLAIRGGSNGGLLVSTVSNQRPELFGAVVCTYPLEDMVRYHKFLVATFWVPEYGSSDDPEQFLYLMAYSPYHNVKESVKYPPTLFITGDGDTRVAPLHGRKMAARLQAMQVQTGWNKPILLRYHTQAGHSGGQPISQQIDEMVDTLSFLEWQIGQGSVN